MAKAFVQRYIVEAPDDASPILPAQVALTTEEGGPLLGEIEKADDTNATVAKTTKAFNALVDALVAANLAVLPDEDEG